MRPDRAATPDAGFAVPAEAPARRQGTAYVFSYVAAVLGTVVMSMTPLTVTLAVRFSDIDPLHKSDSFGWAVAIGNFAQMLGAPIAGRLSDVTRSRRGMRKPWIVGGTLGALLAAGVLIAVPSVTLTLLAWGAMSLSLAFMMTPLFAVIGDQFPEHQHGLVSGLCGSTPLIGILAGSWIVDALPRNPTAVFLAPTAVGAVLILQFSFVLRDRVRDEASASLVDLRSLWRSLHFNPAANASFAWFLLALLLIYTGAMTLQDYLVYLLQDAVKVPAAELTHWTFLAFLVANGAGCLCSIVSGIATDRWGWRRSAFALGTALLACGLVAQGSSHALPAFLAGTLVAGVGYGLLNGLTWALAVETSGSGENMARDMGLVNMALVIPGLIVPLIARLADTAQGYLTMYATCAIFTALALPVIAMIRANR